VAKILEFTPPPPPSRTKWTRRVRHPVLIGHVSSQVAQILQASGFFLVIDTEDPVRPRPAAWPPTWRDMKHSGGVAASQCCSYLPQPLGQGATARTFAVRIKEAGVAPPNRASSCLLTVLRGRVSRPSRSSRSQRSASTASRSSRRAAPAARAPPRPAPPARPPARLTRGGALCAQPCGTCSRVRFLQAVSYVLNKAGGKLSSTDFAVRPAPGEGGAGGASRHRGRVSLRPQAQAHIVLS
jgi:hypothetical protein